MKKTLQCALLFATLWGLFAPGVAQVGGNGGSGNTSTTLSTTKHTTTVIVEEKSQTERLYDLTIRGIVQRGESQEIVFEQAVQSPVDLSPARDTLEQARQAVVAAGATQVELRPGASEVAPPETSTTFEDVNTTTETSVSTSTSFGPTTILVGEDQTQTFFVPAGTTNVNINTHTETFVDQTRVTTTTLTKTASFDVVGAP